MKRIISVIALVLAMTMVMSVSAFAAKEFSVADGAVTVEGMTVTAGADSLDVTVPTTANADYSILLVNGTALPTVDSSIAYINQAKAEGTSLDFDVLPKLDSCGETCTLYIGTNAAGESLISVPVAYAEKVVAGPNVMFMNGADTVATIAAVGGAVVAPAGPAVAPTPAADALIDRYEFVGWTDADGEVTYEEGDSIAVAAETTLYAKYQMYNTWKDKVVKWGDIDGNSFVTAADVSELIYYFDDVTQCSFNDIIKAKIDEDNLGRASYGDIDGNTFVTAADVSELIYYFDDDTQCAYTDIIKTPIYFINE